MTNSDYFENIHTEKQAYFLGLLLTDGSINAANKYTKYLDIALQIQDEHILHVLRDELQAKVTIRKTKTNAARLTIGDNKLVASLAQYGIVPRKTFIASAPPLPQNLQRHFWRGAIDGDGSIKSANRIQLIFCGSETLVSNFKSFCNPIVDRDYKISHPNSIYYYTTNGKNAYRVAKTLYDNATVAIERKIKTYEVIKKYFEDLSYSSNYIGVSWSKDHNKFTVRCTLEGKHRHIGYFKDELEAAHAYDQFVLTYKLDRRINFPESTEGKI